jgi:hypothetical protein
VCVCVRERERERKDWVCFSLYRSFFLKRTKGCAGAQRERELMKKATYFVN